MWAVVIAVLVGVVLFGLVAFIGQTWGSGGGPDTYGLGAAMGCMVFMLFLCVPLGFWKFVEVVAWLIRNVRVSW